MAVNPVIVSEPEEAKLAPWAYFTTLPPVWPDGTPQTPLELDELELVVLVVVVVLVVLVVELPVARRSNLTLMFDPEPALTYRTAWLPEIICGRELSVALPELPWHSGLGLSVFTELHEAPALDEVIHCRAAADPVFTQNAIDRVATESLAIPVIGLLMDSPPKATALVREEQG